MKTLNRTITVLLTFVMLFLSCQNSTKKKVTNTIEQEGIITVDGIDLHYKIEGTGTPIIVTNGWILTSTFSEKLREQCQLIFVDTRSFIPIETPSNLDSWTMDTYVDDIETIRKALKLERVGVLSHSGFGFLPLEYPDNISYAIVIGTPPFIWNNKYNEEAKKYWDTQASEERKVAYQKSLKELEEKKNSGIERSPSQIWVDNYLSNTPKFWYDWNYDATWVFGNPDFNVDVTNNYYFKIMGEYDPSSRYKEIKCPVFIANGKYDFFAVPILWESIVSELDNFSNNIFEKSSHFAMFEEQELFDSKLLKWMKEN